MCDDKLFKKKDQALQHFEAIGNADLQADKTDLAYRHLNSEFFNLEKGTHKGKELSDWESAHKAKKLEIENAWHKATQTDITDLEKRASSTNKKSRDYYRGYTLSELEVFIKNSDRGGNSDLYNSVATELELYNRIMKNGNQLEGLGILIRLKNNAENYRNSKSPNSTKGKIRKAIISVIGEKAEEQIQKQKTEYLTKAEQLYAQVQTQEATDEQVNEAFKAQYALIFQVLNGSIQLSDEELKKLDENTEAVLNKVMTQKVDESQGNNMSTKFFNALGWSSNDARIVKEEELEPDGKEMKKSPLKKKMYHAINPYGDNKDATEAGKQLAGVKKKDNRLFFGLGRFGKGIYTSARKETPKDKFKTYEYDKLAEKNSWSYGDQIGAVQLVMTVNEHAKMIGYADFMRNQEKTFDKKFSKVSKLLIQEQSSKSGYRDFLTMKAAFFGYNTLIDYDPGIKGVEYYVTTDRKALSISREMRIRDNLKDTTLCDTERLEKEK